MPRLFTALELPAAIAADLALMRGGLSGARWIDPQDYHVTLRFFGDLDEATAADLHAILDRARRPAFPVTLDGLGVFGSAKPRAIVAAVTPTSSLLDLQADQERLARRVGLSPEARTFTPHVTLARLRQVSPRSVADYLATRGLLYTRTFSADRVVLMSSRDSVGGGPYVVEATYPFV